VRQHKPLNIITSSPTFDQIERRSKRRSFKLLTGGGEPREQRRVTAITLKCLDGDDGATIWEYGAGYAWSPRYEADEITGIVPIFTDPWIPDRYVIESWAAGGTAPIGNRNAATLVANCEEALQIVTLDSTDGSVVNQEIIDGAFATLIDPDNFQFAGLTSGQFTRTTTLSGGGFIVWGPRRPAIELVGFASNGATKEYILHAHNQRYGTVTLTTRNDAAAVVIPYNATAAAVETLIEAATGVTSATCTGGPWPHRKIEIEVVWSASSNDFATIKNSGTTTAGSMTFNASYSSPGAGVERLELEILTVAVGAVLQLNFQPGGAPYEYTSTTTDPAAFVAALEADLIAFIGTFSGDGFWEGVTTVAVDDTIYIDYADAVSLLVPTGSGDELSRSVDGVATTYDPATGLIDNSVGHVFGFPAGDITRLIPTTTSVQNFASNQTNRKAEGGLAGADDVVIVIPDINNRTCLQAWTPGNPWVMEWIRVAPQNWVYTNAVGNKAMINFARASFSISTSPFSKTRCAATVQMDDGSTTEIDSDLVAMGRACSLWLDETDNSVWHNTALSRPWNGSSSLRYNFQGVNVGFDADTDMALLGQDFPFFGANATKVFGSAIGIVGAATAPSDTASIASIGGLQMLYVTGQNTVESTVLSGSVARNYRWTYDTPHWLHFDADTEFRIRFRGEGLPTLYTAWMPWRETAANIKAAILAVFPENTEGLYSNVRVNPFGDPPELLNSTSLFERNLRLDFSGATAANAALFGFPHFRYVFRGSVGVVIDSVFYSAATGPGIEFRNANTDNRSGVNAWTIADGLHSWGRIFGTGLVSSTPVTYPRGGWVRGDNCYVYGNVVENDLP
jgi:hypothetical protein